MSFNIFPTHRFEKELKRLNKKFPSLKLEFANLLAVLIENPSSGVFLGNNCYKIRIAIQSKGKGKRGAGRIITYLYLKTETIYLLTVYDKSEKSDLKQNELLEIINNLELGS